MLTRYILSEDKSKTCYYFSLLSVLNKLIIKDNVIKIKMGNQTQHKSCTQNPPTEQLHFNQWKYPFRKRGEGFWSFTISQQAWSISTFRMHDWVTCNFLQMVFINIWIKVASQDICTPSFAHSFWYISVISQPHHITDFKFAELVIKIILSCGYIKIKSSEFFERLLWLLISNWKSVRVH